MTKEITKAIILSEIQDKFKLRELEPEVFSLSETVVPVYEIKEHLANLLVRYQQFGVTSTGGLMFFQVPDNERWVLNTYNVIFMGAGAFTVAGVYISRLPLYTDFVYLDLTAGQTVSYAVNLPKPVVLDSRDRIYINIDGYTSTQNLRLYIDYMKEEIR